MIAFMAVSFVARSQFVIEQTDGNKFDWNYGLNVVQDKATGNFSLSRDGNYNPSLDITTVKAVSVQTMENRLSNFHAPAYVDDYRSISSWEKRSQWNLSNVHDPSVMRAEDGYYYMYCTDAGFGDPQKGHGHFHCRRSQNLVDWEYLGATMPELPSWVKPKLNEIRKAMGLGESTANFNNCGYWAPCVRKVKNGLYRMYYVITIEGTIDGPNTWGERAFIGLMETSNPADVSSWEDKGYVITNYSDKELNYKVAPNDWANCYFLWNAIDPSYIITPEGEHWLAYGSWHSGFPIIQINPETGKPLKELGNPWGDGNAEAYGKRIFTRQAGNRWQGAEAPEIIYRSYARNMSMALIWVLTVLTCRALAVTHSLLLPILISSVPILVGWVSAIVLSLMMARAIGSMLRKLVSQRTILSRKIGHRMPLCSVMCAASVGLLRAGLW